MEGFGGFFNDPDFQKRLQEMAEQMQSTQNLAWADNAIKLAVDMTVAAINRVNLQGNAEEQAKQVRAVMATIFPEAVTLVREARQGLTILQDRRRYLREVFAVQLCGWLFRFTAFFLLLEAFNVGGSVRNVLLVLGVNAIAALVPFTPGGAGVQQALLVKVFGSGATVAAYSVGQQIAIAALTFLIGLGALTRIFRFRSFKEVIAQGREARAAEEPRATTGPDAPRAPA